MKRFRREEHRKDGDVTLAPPQTRAELDEDLRVLGTTGPLGDEEYAALAERVRRNAGCFR
jgi:hypothetical protein